MGNDHRGVGYDQKKKDNNGEICHGDKSHNNNNKQ